MTGTIEERVTSLEDRMDEQERLRASQDRDLSDIAEGFRLQDRMLKALAKTQSEHTQTLAAHGRTLDKHTQILNKHTQILNDHTERLGRLEHGMGRLQNGMQKIVGMLDTLIAREDGR